MTKDEVADEVAEGVAVLGLAAGAVAGEAVGIAVGVAAGLAAGLAAGVAVGLEGLVELEPQALIPTTTKTHANRAAVAVALYTIVTCFHCPQPCESRGPQVPINKT